jgi:hypothetical protein
MQCFAGRVDPVSVGAIVRMEFRHHHWAIVIASIAK